MSGFVGQAVAAGNEFPAAQAPLPSDLLVAEAPPGCEGGNGLAFAAYWRFLAANPQCVPIGDDERYESLLAGEDGAGDECDYGSRRGYSGYGSYYGSGRCGRSDR